jgi:hypothetical protein
MTSLMHKDTLSLLFVVGCSWSWSSISVCTQFGSFNGCVPVIYWGPCCCELCEAATDTVSYLPYVAIHKPCTFATQQCTHIFLPVPQKSTKLKSADRFGHFLSCGLSEFELVNWLLWYTIEFSYWTLMQIRH